MVIERGGVCMCNCFSLHIYPQSSCGGITLVVFKDDRSVAVAREFLEAELNEVSHDNIIPLGHIYACI